MTLFIKYQDNDILYPSGLISQIYDAGYEIMITL